MEPKPNEAFENRPRGAFVFDIDGVVCDSWRPEFAIQFAQNDFDRFGELIPEYQAIEWAVRLVQSLAESGFVIIFMTARNERFKETTTQWLIDHVKLTKDQFKLKMRPLNNTDSDHELKRKLTIKLMHRYEILAAFDDKLRNVLMWQDLGIYASHVLT